MNSRKKTVRLVVGAAALALASGLAAVYAVYSGAILLNRPSQRQYPVRGVDVSHYQGDIDWPVLAAQSIEFAYIKATEGSSHVDERFLENWQAAQATGLRVGAYHFFSFDSPGETQLAHFTQTVPAFREMLPPVVDFEFYADKKANPPAPDPLREQLAVLLQGLETRYGVKPVIYATEETHQLYLQGYFDDYPLWIRNVVTKPSPQSGEWLLWQYTNRERLEGYVGEERFIDMNVFSQDEAAWQDWAAAHERAWDAAQG